MKRRIIAPWLFGSDTPFGWSPTDEPSEAQFVPHWDLCQTYREYGLRLWEPGRESYSMPGLDGGEQFNLGPQLPMTTTIHGVKGALHIAFGVRDQDLGEFRLSDGTELPVTDSADPNTVHPRDAWWALIGDGNLPAWPGQVGKTAWESEGLRDAVQLAPLVRIPTFFCLYRGTYKQVDGEAGWEIDSGPNDDPDTLLSMDITNPSVLESSRIDWWDMEMYTLSRTYTQWNAISSPDSFEQTLSTQGLGLHRYAMDLKTNKTLAPEQVLWLHVRTGLVRLPVVFTNTAGNRVLTCATYSGHQFHFTAHCSAMVSQRLSI